MSKSAYEYPLYVPVPYEDPLVLYDPAAPLSEYQPESVSPLPLPPFDQYAATASDPEPLAGIYSPSSVHDWL